MISVKVGILNQTYLVTYRFIVPGDDNKRDLERENLAVLTIAAQTANVIHIRVTFNGVTRYTGKESRTLFM